LLTCNIRVRNQSAEFVGGTARAILAS